MNKYIVRAFHYWTSLFFKFASNVFFSFCNELAIPICINILFLLGVKPSWDFDQALSIIKYVVVANIIYTITMTNIEDVMARDIKDAKLAYKLLTPISPSMDYIISDVSMKLLRCVLFYFPAVFILAILGQFHVSNLIFGVISMVIACAIGYALAFGIGCFSFWITETWGISAIKGLLLSVFAGSLFPLSLLPHDIQTILFLTPFPYLCYFPASLMIDNVQADLRYLGLGVIWAFLLSVMAKLLWRCGLRKYESAGA